MQIMATANRRVVEGSFIGWHALVLEFIDRLPSAILERILFQPPAVCLQLQKALQHVLGGPSSVVVQFEEGPLRNELFECFTSEKYFVLGSNFECRTQAYLKTIIKPGDIVYDVGAHAGLMALMLSTLCGPSGRVFAFEPSPLNFARLERNLSLNNIHNVIPVNFAASDTEGSATLLEMGSYSCLLNEGPRPGENYSQVRRIRLDDFVLGGDHPAPKFLKVDIEGHAGQCLTGAMSLLHEASPIVFCEIHHDEEFSEVRDVFEACSYSMKQMDSARSFPKRFIATSRHDSQVEGEC